MRKSLLDNKLRRMSGFSSRVRAFSIAELVISMGILILMLSLAGQVFTLTIQSTGQATALTEVMQSLRSLEQTLRDDLAHVHPGQSVILIQGNPVNAYWTAKGREADGDGDPAGAEGYPHPADPERESPDGKLLPPRADILMFFTEKPGASFSSAGGSAGGLTSNLQQVVYGHADLGEYFPSTTATGGFEFRGNYELPPNASPPREAFPTTMTGGAKYPSATKVSAEPAENWHLARRSVLILPTPSPTTITPPLTNLDDSRLLDAEKEALHGFRFENQVLNPQWDPMTADPMGFPWFPPAIFGNVSQPYSLWIKPFERSRFDPTPPPALADRLAHYMLPRCASFKVEWSLNPRSEFVAGRFDRASEVFWFDPGDNGDPADSTPSPDPLRTLATRVRRLKNGGPTCPANDDLCLELDRLVRPDDNGRTFHLDGRRYSLSDRFRGLGFPGSDDEAWPNLSPDGRPNLVLFTATRPGPPSPPGPSGPSAASEPVQDDMFPGALRITVDVFDKDRRLERPIRHVMVIPVGG